MSESFPKPARAGFVFTLGELSRELGAELVGDASQRIEQYALDSRAAGPGTLFFALRGERSDGHLWLADVLARGAAAAVVRADTALPAGLSALRIAHPDSVEGALGRLGRLFRQRWPLKVIGITGSAGKTTSKDFTAALLATRYRVFKSEGNLNSTLGLPLTLARRQPEHELAVLELGMSTPGELQRVADIARPDIAVITNVELVHAMNFAAGSGDAHREGDADAALAGIAAEKASLLGAVPPGGSFVACADDPRVMKMRDAFKGPVVTFGLAEGADLRGHSLVAQGGAGTRFTWTWRGGSAEATLPVVGTHHVKNALAALAAAAAAGLDPLTLGPAIEELGASDHRGAVRSLRGGVLLLDDCYNSNPAALRSALGALASLPGKRRVAVLGDMLELGAFAEPAHAAGGRLAADVAQLLVAVGPASRALAEGARAVRRPGAAAEVEVVWYPDAAAAAAAVGALVRDGDAILVKASRGVGLEAVVLALLEARG